MARPRKKQQVVQDIPVVEEKVITKKSRRTHIVRRGESIQSIAGQYSVPVMKLISINGSADICIGQVLYID